MIAKQCSVSSSHAYFVIDVHMEQLFPFRPPRQLFAKNSLMLFSLQDHIQSRVEEKESHFQNLSIFLIDSNYSLLYLCHFEFLILSPTNRFSLMPLSSPPVSVSTLDFE